MIPNIQTAHYETNVVAMQHAFTIEMTPTLAKLLSSQTYSDKTLAAIREPLSNAYDSHVRAGTLDLSAELHLPTQLEPHFSLRDYGTGLSHDDVIRLFFSYGVSDKRGTNTEIGGLGIGAKAFFAYTDQATITSWFNGQKRVYSANKGSNGLPQGMLVHVEETNERDGIELSYSVGPRDMQEFKEKAEEILKYLELRIDCNLELSSKKPAAFFDATIQGHKIEALTANAIERVVMGGIAYHIPAEVWGHKSKLYPGQEPRPTHGVLIHLPIGAVEISASRESLSPTAEDKELLVNLLIEFRKELRAADWDHRLANAQTWIEACEIRGQLQSMLRQDLYYDANGKRLEADQVLRWRDMATYGMFKDPDDKALVLTISRAGRRSNRFISSPFGMNDALKAKPHRVYWIPRNKKVGWRRWYEENRTMDYYGCNFDVHIHAESLEDANKLAQLIGFEITVLDGSGLKGAPKSQGRKTPAARPVGVVWMRGSYDWAKAKLEDYDPSDLIMWDDCEDWYLTHELVSYGVLSTTPKYIRPYGLSPVAAKNKFGHLPKTLLEWCQANPDKVDMEKWADHATLYQLKKHWKEQSSWVDRTRIQQRGEVLGFPVTIPNHPFDYTPLPLAKLPSIKGLTAKIQKWHDTVLPKLPGSIQHHIKTADGYYIDSDLLYSLYQEMK